MTRVDIPCDSCNCLILEKEQTSKYKGFSTNKEGYIYCGECTFNGKNPKFPK